SVAMRLRGSLRREHVRGRERVRLPPRRPPVVMLSRNRTSPVVGLMALSGSAVTPLSWFAISVHVDPDQAQTCPKTAGPVCVEVLGGPTFAPYGFCALTESTVRCAPPARAWVNS